jgi:hypothetical protein
MRKITATRCHALTYRLFTAFLMVTAFLADAPDAAAQNIAVLRQRIVIYDANGLVSMGPDTLTLPSTIQSSQHYVGNRSLDARGGRFAHVYHSNPDGLNAVYFRTCTNGRDWSAPVQVSDPRFDKECYHGSVRYVGSGSGTSRLAATYISHDAVTLQDTLWGTFTTDGGATWAPSKVVGAHPDAVAIIPTLSKGVGDTLYSVWTRATSGQRWDETFINRSRDGGMTWDTMLVAYVGSQFSFYSHAVAGSNGRVWIVTGDDQSSKMNVKISRSTNGGARWSALGNVNTESGLGNPLNMIFYPALERGSGNTIYSVWSDLREGQSNIYFSRSDNMGTNWTPSVRVNGPDVLSPAVNDAGVAGAHRPSIVLSGLGRLYAIWADDREHPSTVEAERNRDIYVAQSTDEGDTWTQAIRVNDAPQVLAQDMPALAIHSTGTRDSLLVTWSDLRGTLTAAPEEPVVAGSAPLTISAVTGGMVRMEIAPSLDQRPLTVTLVDPLGRSVARLFDGSARAGSLALPFDMKVAGVYFLEARCGEARVVEKVVVR